MTTEQSTVRQLRAEAERHRLTARVIRDTVVAAAIIADADELDRRADILEQE
jgi:hypothetical protein